MPVRSKRMETVFALLHLIFECKQAANPAKIAAPEIFTTRYLPGVWGVEMWMLVSSEAQVRDE